MRYLLTRLVHGVGVVFGVSIVVFGLTWLTGDPASAMVPVNTPPEEVARIRQDLGLDRPVPVQYVDFLGRALSGDFGESLRHREPALGLVMERLPNTLRLMAAAVVFALVLSFPLGIFAALDHGRWLDLLARTVAVLGQSLAAPWLGLMLILVFAVNLRWLPSSGGSGPGSLVLPAVVAGAYPAAGLTRLLRSRLLDVLGQEYIVTARAKGLGRWAIVWRHALKNAALPAVTFLGLQVSFLFGSTVVAEAVFAYPGMGRLAVDAITARDVPLVQAFVVCAAIVVVAVNIAVDLVAVWLDPRRRLA